MQDCGPQLSYDVGGVYVMLFRICVVAPIDQLAVMAYKNGRESTRKILSMLTLILEIILSIDKSRSSRYAFRLQHRPTPVLVLCENGHRDRKVGVKQLFAIDIVGVSYARSDERGEMGRHIFERSIEDDWRPSFRGRMGMVQDLRCWSDFFLFRCCTDYRSSRT